MQLNEKQQQQKTAYNEHEVRATRFAVCLVFI